MKYLALTHLILEIATVVTGFITKSFAVSLLALFALLAEFFAIGYTENDEEE